MLEPIIIFIAAGVFLEPLLPREQGSGQLGGGVVINAGGATQSPSAGPLNRLCREAGAELVISDRWGIPIKLARERLVACGITAPFHRDWLAEGGAEWNTGLVGQIDAQRLGDPAAVQHISFQPVAAESPIARWRRLHGNPAAIVIDRPQSRTEPKAISVAIPSGYHLEEATVGRALDMLRKAA